MRGLSKKSDRIKNSPIRKMVGLASQMEDTISFALGEPDFTTPPNVVNAAVEALQRGETHYAPNAGIIPLLKAISNNYKKAGLEYDSVGEIVITSGGVEALFLTMSAILNEGDEVIMTNPYWSNYVGQVTMTGGKVVLVDVFEKDGFMYDPVNLEKAITDRTKLIMVNSPANPTGGVATRAVLEEVARIAKKYDIYVLSDEVYKNFIYTDEEFVSIASCDGMKERTIIIDSFSKAYAMTGWRVAFTAGPRDVITTMIKLQENVVSCVNTAAQFGAVEALEGTQDYLKSMIEEYTKRRSILIEGLNKIDKISCIEPKGAFYAFANITKTGLSSEDFAMRLLKETGVVVVPGVGFGSAGEGFIRMSYATSDENIKEGLRRIEQFVKTL